MKKTQVKIIVNSKEDALQKGEVLKAMGEKLDDRFWSDSNENGHFIGISNGKWWVDCFKNKLKEVTLKELIKILSNQPEEKPKSILDGEVAVACSNDRQFKEICKYNNVETAFNFSDIAKNYDSQPYMKLASYLSHCDKIFFEEKDYKCISFDDFAKEIGIDVPNHAIKSEDGIDLYFGDSTYNVRVLNNKASFCYNSFDNLFPVLTNSLIIKFPNEYKAFASKEKALKWIEENNKPKLEINQWYKLNWDNLNLFIYITKFNNNGVLGYGFSGNFMHYGEEQKFLSYYKNQEYLSHLKLANEKEIFDALEKEAIKRGYVQGVKTEGFNKQEISILTGGFELYQFNTLKANCKSNYFTKRNIFKDGKWAEIIDEPKEIILFEEHEIPVQVKKSNINFIIKDRIEILNRTFFELENDECINISGEELEQIYKAYKSLQ